MYPGGYICSKKKMDILHDESVCCCALNRIFGFKPRIALALISSLGSASEVFRLEGTELDSILGKQSSARQAINLRTLEKTARELEQLQSMGCTFIHIGSPHYPALLKECDDPPVWLYMKSASSPEEIFKGGNHVAIVGTRDISPYGREWCQRIAGAISRSCPTPSVVSGLALGTDITAHMTALECGAPTIAVMATGIDSVYPARHRHIAERIAGTPGCALITDYPPGTAPLQINFLRRNRIIAGLGKATVLIESREKGGGMLTARLAFSYSRDVYALPGRIDDARSRGCNILIKEKAAEPIISEQQLTESIGLKFKVSAENDPVSSVMSAYEGSCGQDKMEKLTKIVLEIKRHRGATVEEIASRTGCGYRETLGYTAMLESDGIIYTDLLQRCYIRLK